MERRKESITRIQDIVRQTGGRNLQIFSGLCCGCSSIFFTLRGRKRFCSLRCLNKFFSGRQHPGYKGGSRRTKLGYVMLRGGGPQQWEHKAVMERFLGRSLRRFESVHHKNGLRWDNRLKNLELWASRRKQPYGQRVRDMLVFIAKYYPEEMRRELTRRRRVHA